METKMISIITPLFNAQDTFVDTYNSVIIQTFTNWEWIIIDDCSTDNSFEIVSKLIEKDDRISLVRTNKNGGSAVARNFGLKIARGKYITFLDADDLLDENFLAEQFEFIKENGPIITASYRRKAPHSCTDFIVPSVIDYKQILKGNPLSCLTTMYDREVIGDRLFPVNLRKCEDYVFWLDILKEGFKAKGNQKVLATYLIHKNSKSFNKFKLIKYMFIVYHKTQKINFFKSWYYVVRWAFYGKKKYKNVK